jgi:hypothetical protein
VGSLCYILYKEPNQGVSCQPVMSVTKKGKNSICSSYSSFIALLKKSKLGHTESRYQLINHAKKTNNCNAARSFKVSEEHFRLWRQPTEKLLNVNTQQCCSGPKYGHFHELEQGIVESVYLQDTLE